MKSIPLLTLVVALGLSTTAFAEIPPTANYTNLYLIQVAKEDMPHGTPTWEGRVGGETIATAVPIFALPYTDVGNTCNFLDDYDEACPWTGYAPDAVYAYTPGANITVDISLCDSYYDTKLFVYQDSWTPGFPYACNDDACSGPNYPYSYLSYLGPLPLTGGHTYYIVVDGYGSDCGDYILDVTEHQPCAECPPGAYVEQEPPEFDYMNDTWNGGCNSTPPVFESLDPACGTDLVTVCGTSGTDSGISYRDTDWFEIKIQETTTLTICGIGEFPIQMFLIDAGPGCANVTILDSISGASCEQVCMIDGVGPGTYWIWVGPSVFSGFPKGLPYLLTIDGYYTGGPSATEQTRWGEIKKYFR